MRLSIKAMTAAGAIVWGIYGMFASGMLNLLWPPYGEHFLITMSSVYPGYHATRTLGDVLVATLYGTADGAVLGLLLAWTYNFFVPNEAPSPRRARTPS
jgi:hypothetical protein